MNDSDIYDEINDNHNLLQLVKEVNETKLNQEDSPITDIKGFQDYIVDDNCVLSSEIDEVINSVRNLIKTGT